MKFEYSTLFFIRNIKRNAEVKINGILPNAKTKLPNFLYNFCFGYYTVIFLLRSLFGKLDIPQIEFPLTTDCNLKCLHCKNYTPAIFNNNDYLFEDFKYDLDNILKHSNTIQYVSLSGGEPFLIENLEKFIEYTASKKQIKNIVIFTNGTILPNNKVVSTLKKYNKKICVYTVDFSNAKNFDKTLLRIKKLTNLFNRNKIKYIVDTTQEWQQTFINTNFEKFSEKFLINIYSKCINPNISCFIGKISPCPKATSFQLLNISEITEDQYLDIRKEDFSKEKIKQWYSEIKPFKACGLCDNYVENIKKSCTPGEQQETNLYW